MKIKREAIKNLFDEYEIYPIPEYDKSDWAFFKDRDLVKEVRVGGLEVETLQMKLMPRDRDTLAYLIFNGFLREDV